MHYECSKHTISIDWIVFSALGKKKKIIIPPLQVKSPFRSVLFACTQNTLLLSLSQDWDISQHKVTGFYMPEAHTKVKTEFGQGDTSTDSIIPNKEPGMAGISSLLCMVAPVEWWISRSIGKKHVSFLLFSLHYTSHSNKYVLFWDLDSKEPKHIATIQPNLAPLHSPSEPDLLA